LYAAVGFHEHHRLFGYRQIRFSRVIGVVQTDGDELAHMADRATHAWLAAHQRQIGCFDAGQFGQFFVAQMLGGDVFDDA